MRHVDTPATPVTVTLFESEDFPGLKLFKCVRLRADLSPRACVRNYENARCEACISCPIGAHHCAASHGANAGSAGAEICDFVHRDNLARRAALSMSNGRTSTLPCVRCGQTAASKKRLIGRMRLVRGHTLCVSCYNREREVLHGANAKGGRPVKWGYLTPAQIEIEYDGQRRAIEIGLCSGEQEARRVVARRWPTWRMIAYCQVRPNGGARPNE